MTWNQQHLDKSNTNWHKSKPHFETNSCYSDMTLSQQLLDKSNTDWDYVQRHLGKSELWLQSYDMEPTALGQVQH